MKKKLTEQEKKNRAKNYRLYKTYGITLDDYNRMFELQKGVCLICGALPKTKTLCVDHRHVKGYKERTPEEKANEVRGLLCFLCNKGLGAIERRKDCRRIFNRIIAYFAAYKMRNDVD